jgi:hypothetical protein
MKGPWGNGGRVYRVQAEVLAMRSSWPPRLAVVATKQILVALTAGDHLRSATSGASPRRRPTSISAVLGQAGTAVHLSVRGLNDRFDGHRFYIKVDHQIASSATGQGYFMEHGVPRKGSDSTAWTWHLQRPRFRSATISGQAPQIARPPVRRTAFRDLAVNDAWDIDLAFSQWAKADAQLIADLSSRVWPTGRSPTSTR